MRQKVVRRGRPRGPTAAATRVRKQGGRPRAPPGCLTYRRKARQPLTRLLPVEMLAEIARWTDDGTFGACLLASRDLALAFAREAVRRRAWLAQPLRQLAAHGDTQGLAWARRRACAQGRPHFRFGHACFHAAAGAGRLATLRWLYADQRRHGLATCCSTTSVLCKAAEGDHVDVVAWMLASMGALCSVAHAVNAAIQRGASRVFALLCRHAGGTGFVDRQACKHATGVDVLVALDRRGLLDPDDMGSLLRAAPRDRPDSVDSGVASIEWLCRSAFGDRCDWNRCDVRSALGTIIQFGVSRVADWRRMVDTVTLRVHSTDLWTDILYAATRLDAVDVVGRAWPLATPNADTVGSIAAGSGSADVLDWLTTRCRATLADHGLAWAKAAANHRRWGLAHRLYAETAATVTHPRRLADAATALYRSAIASGDVPALERIRVVCGDVLTESAERASFHAAFTREARSFYFEHHAMIAYACAHVPDVVAQMTNKIGSEFSDAPAGVFASLLTAAPRVRYGTSLVYSLLASGRDDIAAVLLAARKDLADRIDECPAKASTRVRALLHRECTEVERLCEWMRRDDSQACGLVVAAMALGPDACGTLLWEAAREGRYDVAVDCGALADLCSPGAVCGAGLAALRYGRLDLARRLFARAAARGCTPEPIQLSGTLGRARERSLGEGEGDNATVDQPSAYEIAAYAATLRPTTASPTARDVANAVAVLAHGDVACGLAILGGVLSDALHGSLSKQEIGHAFTMGRLDGLACLWRASGPLAAEVVAAIAEKTEAADPARIKATLESCARFVSAIS
ncbi:hypothetical protein pdul_cds_647 [Pandoravirus dulcis]|uniref:Ankyrin repeat domain containing protein n=1 Tax=Pandoravirus dulcis TaxID=1349409 RepID=S4VY19_9VIRU|nr:hypothetical protein pdul_cds_647 [Pandoravirus dulcis]AGO82789.1 hypothetical protein pdul_cds_647 [Pandoravirus dulcis]